MKHSVMERALTQVFPGQIVANVEISALITNIATMASVCVQARIFCAMAHALI